MIYIIKICIFTVAGLSWLYNPMNAYSTGVAPATFQSVDNLITVDMKQCSKCREVKSFSEFFKSKNKSNGLHNQCKVCSAISQIQYHQTKPGLISKIYQYQKKNSRQRNHHPPIYTGKQFLEFALKSNEFHTLFAQWVKSGYDRLLVPTFDRADDYKGYSFENFNRFMTWGEHKEKSCSDRRNGINNKTSRAVISTHKTTGENIGYYSIAEASRQTGVSDSHISRCCLSKRPSAGGYYWKYKNEI